MTPKKSPGKEDMWRTRRVTELYAAGEPIAQISRLVGWSEERVREVLREASIIVTDYDRDVGYEK